MESPRHPVVRICLTPTHASSHSFVLPLTLVCFLSQNADTQLGCLLCRFTLGARLILMGTHHILMGTHPEMLPRNLQVSSFLVRV